VSDVGSPRRYYLLKRNTYRRLEETALEGVYQWKQGEESGSALPSTFPFRTELAAVGYTAREDLIGADTTELTRNVGLTLPDAEAVLAAFANL
jgi:hypothetical protein